MSSPTLALALVATFVFGAGPAAAQKRLTVLFTGDNGGEIAPCG